MVSSTRNHFKLIFTKEFTIEQWICPPHHGKGECDVLGAIVKKKAKWFLLLSSKDEFIPFL